ncbi:MAG: hypothetical protein ACRDT8_22980, partial [Micromonosporaceae bacterium]
MRPAGRGWLRRGTPETGCCRGSSSLRCPARKELQMEKISKRLLNWASILEPKTRRQAELAS